MLAVTKQILLFSLQVLAVILLILSAATSGVIVNNDVLEALRTFAGLVDGPAKDLLDLINGSLGIAGWLIVLFVVVLIAEIVFIVINIIWPSNLISGIIEILFNIAVILCYFASGIAAGVFAAGWGGPPELCPDPDSPAGDLCDSIPLTATNALECVFSFLQIGALGVVVGMNIFAILKGRSQAT
jgi:hypothetical protein